MKKKARVVITTAALALMLAAPAVFAAPDNEGVSGVTRGQFFKQITDQLKLVPANASTPLPKDVSADSVYADTVRVLIERGIIDGYSDGTFRTERPITGQEAGLVLGRFLGINDTEAAAQLESGFGVSLGEGDSVNPASAAQAIQSALASDPSAQAFLEKSQAAQELLTSFSAHIIQETQLKWRAGSDNLPNEPMRVAAESELAYDKDSGMHIVSTMIPPAAGNDSKVEVEQYIVPDGSFFKTTDPVSKQPKWFNVSNQMPYSFNDLMAIKQKSLELNKALNKSFFYRDLGSEQQDGKTLRKIGLYGKISSLDDFLAVMGSVETDKSVLSKLTQNPELRGMSVSINGTVYMDEQTLLPEQLTMNMSLHYPDGAGIPIEQTDMHETVIYKEFNTVKPITLPEEAKQAPELTIPSVPPAQGDTKPNRAEPEALPE